MQCPFCNSNKAYVRSIGSFSRVHYFVECDKCNARNSDSKERNTAIEQWNKINILEIETSGTLGVDENELSIL